MQPSIAAKDDEESSSTTCSFTRLTPVYTWKSKAAASTTAAATTPKPRRIKSSSSNHHRDLIDLDLAKELNELSFQEREKALEDVHGVSKAQAETPELLSKCMKQLDDALQNDMPRSKRKAYDRAVFLRPTILTDDAYKFKLMFLRAEHYDAKKAAFRMIKYFDEKQKLFGSDKLVKKITLDDLEEKGMELFEKAIGVVLPHKDQNGRPIWFFDASSFEFDHLDSMIRCSWYMTMATLEDEAAQLKGVCDISYAPGNIAKMASSFSTLGKRINQIQHSLPCVRTSYHFCYDDPAVQCLVSLIGVTFGKKLRARLRAHFGSATEMEYSLMTFGILCQGLFGKGEDNIKPELQAAYIQRRRVLEAEEERQAEELEKQTGIIIYPKPNDVLVGRGRPYQEFPGNRKLGQLVDDRMERYKQCVGRFEKTCCFMDVVKTIQESNGRFIERRPKAGGWQVVDDTVAREKIANGFRFKLIREEQQNNNNNNNNDTNGNGKQQQQLPGTRLSPSAMRAPKRFRKSDWDV